MTNKVFLNNDDSTPIFIIEMMRVMWQQRRQTNWWL